MVFVFFTIFSVFHNEWILFYHKGSQPLKSNTEDFEVLSTDTYVNFKEYVIIYLVASIIKKKSQSEIKNREEMFQMLNVYLKNIYR